MNTSNFCSDILPSFVKDLLDYRYLEVLNETPQLQRIKGLEALTNEDKVVSAEELQILYKYLEDISEKHYTQVLLNGINIDSYPDMIKILQLLQNQFDDERIKRTLEILTMMVHENSEIKNIEKVILSLKRT